MSHLLLVCLELSAASHSKPVEKLQSFHFPSGILVLFIFTFIHTCILKINTKLCVHSSNHKHEGYILIQIVIIK